MKQGPRILVTDAGQRAVLAACRGLAMASYRVSAVAGERIAVAHWSRFLEKRIMLAGLDSDPQGYVERLSQVLRRDKYDIIMPGSELSLLPISERRDLIEPYARLELPPHEVVLRVLDKPFLHGQASAVGLAPPRTIVCSSEEEALTAARKLTLPLIVKPVRSVTWTVGQRQEKQARIVEDATLLEATVAAVGVPVAMQHYIPGATIVSCAAVRVDRQLRGLTFARYIRTHPLENGDAAMAITITPPGLLAQRIEKLLGLLEWHGIFELELLEISQNRFGAIDFNPRPFGWMSLAIEAGANLPALWCDHVLRRHSVPSGGAQAGVRYRRGDADMRNVLTLLGRGRLRPAVTALRPHRHVVHPYFQIDDPGPAVARMISVAQKAMNWRSISDVPVRELPVRH